MIQRNTVFLTFILIAFFLLENPVKSQEKNEQSAKQTAFINLSYLISDGVRSIKVKVNRKENKKFIPIEDVKVYLSLVIDDTLKKEVPNDIIFSCVTDEDGIGLFTFSDDFYKTTTNLHVFNFIAKIENDLKYEDTEEEITILDAFIKISTTDDSIKTVTAKLTSFSDSLTDNPVPETEMKLFIKRTFSLLPFGEEGLTTDTEGEISGEIPSDIPGNTNGTLTLVARVEDHESFGTVETTKEIKWDILPKQNVKTGRTLWATAKNAPMSLIVIALIILISIWGTMFYIVTQLFKIKIIGKKND